jgi:hypothetical protein
VSEITDQFMREMLSKAKRYSFVILRHGPNYNNPGKEKVVWEHARRNFALRRDGVLPIVCPVNDGGDVAGMGIFNGAVDEIKKVMDDDPGVKEGRFTYEIHDCVGFPGSCLP